MSELKADRTFVFGEECEAYKKYEADKVIAEKDKEIEKLKSDISDLRDDKKLTDSILVKRNTEIAELKADYDEVRGRLQTANLIKDEQKAKADKLLSCLKYLVMGDLIKDCPPKKVAKEIVKEYDNGLG